MALPAAPRLEHRFMGVRNLGHPALEGFVAVEAELRHFFYEEYRVIGTVRLVTGRAGRDLDWRVDKGSLLESGCQILMTGKTPLVYRAGKEVFFRRTMRIVACGAGAGGDRTVNMFVIKGGVIVATETETAEVITVFQKVSAIGAVGPMAGQTVAALDRGMNNRSFAGGLMAGGAQLLPLCDQREPFFPR
jgi:hypothetical protein